MTLQISTIAEAKEHFGPIKLEMTEKGQTKLTYMKKGSFSFHASRGEALTIYWTNIFQLAKNSDFLFLSDEQKKSLITAFQIYAKSRNGNLQETDLIEFKVK